MNQSDEFPEILSREDLYALVWAEPMSRLASRFGYSDVGLAKACARMMVPVPGRGYWAKKEVGRSPRPTKLPTLPASAGAEKRELRVRMREPRKASDAVLDEPEVIVVAVPEILTDPHPLVAATVKAYRGGRTDHEGFLRPRILDCLSVSVSMGSIDRAMRIYDAVIRKIEERGDIVEVQKYKQQGYDQPRYRTVVVGDGELIEIDLSESRTRVDHRPDPKEMFPPKYDLVPSGRLGFTIRTHFSGARANWADDAKQTLESRLGKFVHALAVAAVDLKQQRARQEEYERQRIESQHRELEENERRRAEAGRIRALDSEMDRMHTVRWVREYLEKVKASISAHPEANTEAMQNWIAWVEGYAERIDPLLPYPAVPKDPKPWA